MAFETNPTSFIDILLFSVIPFYFLIFDRYTAQESFARNTRVTPLESEPVARDCVPTVLKSLDCADDGSSHELTPPPLEME